MDSTFNSNFLPHDRSIYIDTAYLGEIRFSQQDKDTSSFSLFSENRASSSLGHILTGLTRNFEFKFGNELGTDKIADVARAIFERYETRYNASYWM